MKATRKVGANGVRALMAAVAASVGMAVIGTTPFLTAWHLIGIRWRLLRFFKQCRAEMFNGY